MTMNSRGLIKALIGGAVAIPNAVPLKQAAAALGVPLGPVIGGVGANEAAIGAPAPSGVNASWRVANTIREMRYCRDKPERFLPPHIAAMKSWSPVYKAGIHAREEAILQAYLRKMEDDEGFAAKVIAAMLGEAP